MIKDTKKIDPNLGMAIGWGVLFFGVFGIHFGFGDKLSIGLFMLSLIPFVIVATLFLSSNSYYLYLRREVRLIEKSAEKMNPMTYLNWSYAITKIKTISDLYIISSFDEYFMVLRMNEKTNVSVSWIRRYYRGPKLPTIDLLEYPILTEFNGFEIRKCEEKVVLYDIDENQWISGQATIFYIFFNSKPLKQMLVPETFQGLIDIIDRSN